MVEISVIIPVYNVEKYLKDCLDSLVNQSFEDLEIICVNDGSTDDSLNILNECRNSDSRIRIITQENRGLGAARNTGLDNAEGKYVYFIDADDYLDLNAFEKFYQISQEKDLDLLIFKLVNFDEETGKMDYDYSNMPFLLDIGKDVFSYEDFKDDLLNVEVSACTKFFKRELIEDKRFPEGLIFEDNAFNIDYLLDARRIHFLDECLYYRRVRSNSIITGGSKNYSDIIDIFDIIYRKFERRGLYSEFKERLFMRKTDAIYYRFTLIEDEYKAEYYRLMKESFLGHRNEYENNFDLSILENYHKNLFKAVIESNSPEEVDYNFKLNQLKTKSNQLKKENKRLKKENKKLKKQSKKVKKENEELLSSRSWKITTPLRKLKRKL